MAGTQLSSIAPILLPPTITGPIFDKIEETSAVQQLAQKVPLSVNAQTAIPVSMDTPVADWVSEGASKPVGAAGTGVKIMTGKKVALLLPVSQEIAMTNAAGLYDQMQQILPTAISRAFDFAAIHGKSLKTGGAGPFADYLADTPNSQVIGASAASAGGAYTDLVLGMQQVVNNSYDFTGFAGDPRLKPELMLSTDTQGRPLWVGNDPTNGLSGNGGTLIGYPAYYNTGVSGKYRRNGDAVQIVTLVGTPTGGTFTITVGGLTSAPIAYNANAATVQAAIQAIGSGSVFGGSPAATATVAGSSSPWTVTFPGAAAPITVDQTGLTGGTAAASLATVTQDPVTDTGLRAIGGDWSQCAYGVGMDISIKLSTEASYTPDGGTTWISAFQNNLVLLLVEAFFGFVRNDKNAFVAYTHSVGS